MPVYFTTLGMSDKRWDATLRQIMPTPTVTNNVVLYTALFDVDNTSGDLMTQMTAQVFFVRAAAKDVVLVPVAALHAPKRPKSKPPGDAERQGGLAPTGEWKGPGDGAQRRAVTVLLAGGRKEERIVTVGVTNRVSAEIRSGLEPGDKVVVNQKDPTRTRNRSSSSQQRQSGRPPAGMGGFR